MIWIYLLILVALSVAAYLGGRALAVRRAVGAKPHSRPGQHGAYALIWVAAPALLVLVLMSLFSAPLERQLTAVDTPPEVAADMPYAGGDERQGAVQPPEFADLGQRLGPRQQQQLMRMLQLLQLQQPMP